MFTTQQGATHTMNNRKIIICKKEKVLPSPGNKVAFIPTIFLCILRCHGETFQLMIKGLHTHFKMASTAVLANLFIAMVN